MFVAFVLMGAIAGFVTGVAVLFNGASIWIALLVYSGVGVVSAVAGVAAMMLAERLRSPQPQSPLQLGVQD